jgi:phytoene synthase
MRLTTILRDVKPDFARGRVYLPQEDFARFGYTERELAAGVVNEDFRELVRFEIARARELYRDGAEGICWLAGDGSRLAASVIAVTHAGVLDAIERKGYDVLAGRPARSIGQQLRRAPLAWWLARRRLNMPMPAQAFWPSRV